MARPKPYGIRFRTLIPNAVRRIGYKSFGTKGFFGDYHNQLIYEQAQEHVLGTETNVNEDDATIWYDDSAGVFKDRLGATVTLADFDRVAMIVATADQDIDFPVGKTIEFVPYDVVDLDSNTLNLPGTYSGELRVNNGSVVITGTCHGLVINGTAIVDTSGMSGTAIINGSIFTSSMNVSWTHAQIVGSALNISGISAPALAALNGTDVAFIDETLEDLRAYQFNGSVWALVSASLNIPGINGPSLAALSSTDVALVAATLDELRTYRLTGSTWAIVGSGLSIPGISSGSALCALNSTDVAFIDSSLDELRTYRFNGSTWSLVGSGLSITGVSNPSLTALNSADVAFADSSLGELRTYRFDGSSWSQVGSSLSAGQIGDIASLNVADIAIADSANDELRTYRFNGSTWVQVGSFLSVTGISGNSLAALNGTDVAFIDSAVEDLGSYRFGFSIGDPYRP